MASILILSHSDIFDDVLCWCLLQASYGKHFDSFSFRNIWWCFVLVPSTGKLLGKQWCGTTCPRPQSNCVQDYLCHLFLWTILPMCLPWFRPYKPMCLLVERPISHKCCSKCSLGIMCHVLELSGSICKASFSSSIYCNANFWQALGIFFVSLHSMQA